MCFGLLLVQGFLVCCTLYTLDQNDIKICEHLYFRFKEVFYDETYLAIVMEYASQGHLSAMLKRQGKLSETDARR